jgi:hypothetical protein
MSVNLKGASTRDAPEALDRQDYLPPTAAGLPPARRLLLLCVALPAFVAITNQLVFFAISDQILSPAWLYPWMTFTTAFLSWGVGRHLDSSWLRWVVFTWCLLMLDIITNAACLGGMVPDHVGYVLVSAQITFVIVCAILGPWGWQWRLPLILVAVAAVIVQANSFMDSWNARSWLSVMVLTAAVATLLCLALRLAGFRLQLRPEASSLTVTAKSLQVNQFGVKHMLAWATAIVPILLVARRLDGMFLSILGQGGASAAVCLAVCVAAIDLAALWLALGRGLFILRTLAFLAVPFLAVIGLTYYSIYFQTLYGRWNDPPISAMFIEMRNLWPSWIWLAAGLTAALLLFLRAAGYGVSRLTRHAFEIPAA